MDLAVDGRDLGRLGLVGRRSGGRRAVGRRRSGVLGRRSSRSRGRPTGRPSAAAVARRVGLGLVVVARPSRGCGAAAPSLGGGVVVDRGAGAAPVRRHGAVGRRRRRRRLDRARPAHGPGPAGRPAAVSFWPRVDPVEHLVEAGLELARALGRDPVLAVDPDRDRVELAAVVGLADHDVEDLAAALVLDPALDHGVDAGLLGRLRPLRRAVRLLRRGRARACSQRLVGDHVVLVAEHGQHRAAAGVGELARPVEVEDDDAARPGLGGGGGRAEGSRGQGEAKGRGGDGHGLVPRGGA